MCPANQCIDTFDVDLAFFASHTLDPVTHAQLVHQASDGMVTVLVRLKLEWLRQCLQSAALDEANQVFKVCDFQNLSAVISRNRGFALKFERLPISDFLVQLAQSKVDPLVLFGQE